MNQMQKNVFLTYFKTTFLLIATFLFGLVVATGVARTLEQSKNTVVGVKPNPVDFRDVFVLKNTVREGEEIFPENVKVARLHKNEVPRGVVKTYQQIDGRAARVEISQGTVLLDEYFVSQIPQNSVLGFIPPGFHSVTVQVHEVTVDGQNNLSAVQPGDQVDIIIVQQNTGQDDKSREFVLLENIPVIGTFWDTIGGFQSHEKRGTISLLLSDSQRKNLEEGYQDGTKIRLRICSPEGIQTVSGFQPHPPTDLMTHDFYQTGHQPELISQSLRDDASPIEIVFRNKQELKPMNHNELQIPSFRGIPVESYADKTANISPVSTMDQQKDLNSLNISPPVPRYSSFFDASSQTAHGTSPWKPAVPRSPLVFEARPNPVTQARGIYRDGGVYYSFE
jgi:Flp pilus assembly protein CpaB